MTEDLFQPSLKQDNDRELKTYDISKLFYVAFFGGVVPTIALGTQNAKWLRIDKKLITLMIILGHLLLFSKVIVASLLLGEYIEVSTRTIRWIYKVGSLLLYMGYYSLMKNKFKQLIITNGNLQPMLKDAIKWIVIGIIVEVILLSLGGSLIQNVL